MSPALKEARTADPIQFALQCDIVRAAYELAKVSSSDHTRKYMEELMESYGIERTTE